MSKIRFIPTQLITLLLLIILASCTKNSLTVEAPLDFEEGYLNNQVLLFATAQGNTFKTTDPIAIGMTFRTDTEIVFPNNYNLRLFIKDKESWREISEKPFERYPTGEFVFSPSTSPQVHFFFVEPDIGNIEQKYLLRIYVAGNMMEKGISKTVASYLDIELRP